LENRKGLKLNDQGDKTELPANVLWPESHFVECGTPVLGKVGSEDHAATFPEFAHYNARITIDRRDDLAFRFRRNLVVPKEKRLIADYPFQKWVCWLYID
jgi:hypothetical protein